MPIGPFVVMFCKSCIPGGWVGPRWPNFACKASSPNIKGHPLRSSKNFKLEQMAQQDLLPSAECLSAARAFCFGERGLPHKPAGASQRGRRWRGLSVYRAEVQGQQGVTPFSTTNVSANISGPTGKGTLCTCKQAHVHSSDACGFLPSPAINAQDGR